MRLYFFILIYFLFFSCTEKNNNAIEIKSTQQLQSEIEKELPLYLTSDSILKIDSVELTTYQYFKKIYSTHPLFFNQSKLNSNGDSLLHIISSCEYYGLIAENYHLSKIKKELDLISQRKNHININSLIKADLLLSDAYFLMGAHLNKGRFDKDSLCLKTNFEKLPNNWDSVLNNGLKNKNLNNALSLLEPKHIEYRMLKKQLANIINDTSFYFYSNSITFTTEKDSIKKINLIKESLIKQGFYDTTTTLNDSIKFAKALMLFQKKWFLEPDGKLGKYTKQALSYNREKIIRQLNITMERWRWEDANFPDRYVVINIPSFWLKAIYNDTVRVQSAVVCGKPETETPVLSSKINYLLIYPYWNVPTSIATKEILPAVQKDINYLERKNFEVIDNHNQVLDYEKIHWAKYSKIYLPVRFRQRIGNENSLGIVKFNFNNLFGVYLHDTNSKRYFKTNLRAQSHGCIRLEKFSELADFLIKDDSLHYTHDSLQLYFSNQIQRKINLKKQVPIYIRYFTAEVDNNNLKLYLDIYNKDKTLIDLLYK